VAPNAQLGVQMFMLTVLDPHQVHVSLRRLAPAGQRGSGRRWWVRRTTVLLSAVVLAVCGAAVPAQAAPPHGIDVSYPQCGKPLPTGQAFAIVGVNHGSAATTNPCLDTQLAWAEGSTGETVHDGVQLYVNTGNPAGGALWPRSGNTPYGDCDGSNSRPCAYQYGWERARDDATIRGISHPERYMWWLDVEIANAWDYTDGGGTRNAAVLEGMTDYFTSVSPRGVGLYSTKYQWGRIVGSGVDANSSLNGLSNWRPTGSTLERAQANCGLAPLTPGGVIEMTQYTTTLDYNHSCI
jgi:hypothetical protein